MSKKVAKLVRVSLVTRVIVDADASESDILIQSQMKFIEQIANEIHENLEEIVDDTECPYEELEVEDIENYIDVYASDDRSDEVFDILSDEYLHSDITSGEMIYSTTLSLEYNEGDVREGVQTFLDWDDSPETFKLVRGDKHWIIMCL